MSWWYWRTRDGIVYGPFWTDTNSALYLRPSTMPWDATLYKHEQGKWRAYL